MLDCSIPSSRKLHETPPASGFRILQVWLTDWAKARPRLKKGFLIWSLHCSKTRSKLLLYAQWHPPKFLLKRSYSGGCKKFSHWHSWASSGIICYHEATWNMQEAHVVLWLGSMKLHRRLRVNPLFGEELHGKLIWAQWTACEINRTRKYYRVWVSKGKVPVIFLFLGGS